MDSLVGVVGGFTTSGCIHCRSWLHAEEVTDSDGWI